MSDSVKGGGQIWNFFQNAAVKFANHKQFPCISPAPPQNPGETDPQHACVALDSGGVRGKRLDTCRDEQISRQSSEKTSRFDPPPLRNHSYWRDPKCLIFCSKRSNLVSFKLFPRPKFRNVEPCRHRCLATPDCDCSRVAFFLGPILHDPNKYDSK